MAWQKPPPYMIELFDSLLPDDARVSQRTMFGNPCGFVNGNMYFGLFEGSMFLRLSRVDRELAQSELGATPFDPLEGRPMREYVSLPEDVLEDDNQLEEWLAKSLGYAGTLPPKKKKPRKKKT